MILLFLLASLTVKIPETISGIISYECPVEITSTKQETLNISLTLDSMESIKDMSIKDVSVWCDSIPVIKERPVYCVQELKGKWQDWFISLMIKKEDTIRCEKGYYWCKEWGLVKGILKEEVLTDSNHFVGYDKYIEFKSGYVSVGKTTSDLDKIIIPVDLISSDKTIATTVINKYKTIVGTKNDTRILVNKNYIIKGGLNNVIIPKGISKVKITFRKNKAELGKINGKFGIVIKDIRGKILTEIDPWWEADYDYRQVIVLNNDSLTGDLTNFIFPCWWLAKATHTVGTKAIVDKDDATQLWVDSESDSIVWILKPIFDYNANDSVYYYIDTDGVDVWDHDSVEKVRDTTNGWLGYFNNKYTGDTLWDETYKKQKAVRNNTVRFDTTGVLGNGFYFTGAGGNPAPLLISNVILDEYIGTIVYWQKATNIVSNSLLSQFSWRGTDLFEMYVKSYFRYGYGIQFVGNPVALDTVKCYHAYTWNKDVGARNHRNGVLEGYVDIQWAPSIFTDLGLGSFYNAGYPYFGFMNHFGILRIVQSDNFIKNEYLFMLNTSPVMQTWRAEQGATSGGIGGMLKPKLIKGILIGGKL